MVDLDSDPTKLLEVIAIGKQLLITRGSITTFSIANDVAKYFAILPAMFVAVYPELNALNIMGLATPQSAILSAVIFNALIIIALIPLALRGVGVPGRAGQRAAPAQPAHLRPRRDHRAVHRDQGDRPDRRPPSTSPRNMQMTRFLRHVLWPAFALLLAMTVITGVVYPAVVTAIAQVAFPHQANGSMIVVDGTDRRLEPDRPGLQRAASTSGAARRPPARTATTRAARPARTWARRTRRSSIGSPPRSTDCAGERQRARSRSIS